MIYNIKDIGHILLEGKNEFERYQQTLSSLMIVPNEPMGNQQNANYYHEVIVNLNTKDKKIELKMGNELSVDNKTLFSGFAIPANSKKIAFTTNNIEYLIFSTIPDMMSYMKESLDSFYDFSKYDEFYEFLKKIKKEFYKKIEIGDELLYFLNFELLDSSSHANSTNNLSFKDLNNLLDVKNRIKKESKNKIKKAISNFYKKLVAQDVFNITLKQFKNLNIFCLKIDNEYIHNIYKEEYNNIIYNQKVKGNFIVESHENNLCHLCGEKKETTGKIDLPTKFYITDKEYFFEGTHNKNAYKSFAICQNCYQEVVVGSSFVKEKLSNSFFGIPFYILPKKITKDFHIKYKYFIEILQSSSSNLNSNLSNNATLIQEIKEEKLSCDFLFYEKKQSAFKIIELIPEIKFVELENVIKQIQNINPVVCNIFFNFSDIYYLLFPSKKVRQKKVDAKIFSKEFLTLLHNILKTQKVSYHYILKKFLYINKQVFLNTKNRQMFYDANVLKMNGVLTLFYNLKILEEEQNMTEGSSFINITHSGLKNFFKAHEKIYGGNNYKQGLVILGMLINSILYAQKEKNINFLRKLNFDGVSVNRIHRLINEVTEFLTIYRIQQKTLLDINSSLYQAMVDRLQGIETSKLKSDEVLFFILTGASLGKYLGIQQSEQNKQKKENENE